jgi:hypothetical protein
MIRHKKSFYAAFFKKRPLSFLGLDPPRISGQA